MLLCRLHAALWTLHLVFRPHEAIELNSDVAAPLLVPCRVHRGQRGESPSASGGVCPASQLQQAME